MSCRLVPFFVCMRVFSTSTHSRLWAVAQATALGTSGEDLLHLSCPPPFFHSHSHSPLPLTSVYLSYPHSLSLSLSPPKLAQLSISPPAVPPAVSPPRARSPTTIQVTGQEKEHAAFTMGQWRPIKQSFPFSPALFHHCRDWKRQTFGEVVRGAGGLQGCRATFPSTYNCLKDHSDKHSNTLLLTRFSRCHHGSLSNSRAIMLFNTIVKVKTEACGVISNVRNPVNSRRLKIRAHWIFGSMMK